MKKYYSERKKNYQFLNNYLLFTNNYLIKIKSFKIILNSKDFKKNILLKYINVYNKLSVKKINIQQNLLNNTNEKPFFKLIKTIDLYEFQIFLKLIKNTNKNIIKKKEKWLIHISGIYINNFLYHSNNFIININFYNKNIKTSTAYNYIIKSLN